MNIDPYILTFSAVTVIVTIFMGFWSAKKSRTASDFFVAGRSVSVGWNASAISGEYLSAASFMGIAGMVMSSGYDALWYPVCYACGYLFLLLFIAGPLRRFGAYTIPDFAEGRFDSPLFRKIAVVFVLFIGFFYTMPQMKGAGTTLAYIFQDVDLRGVLPDFLLGKDAGGLPARGLPYWAGVVLVGAVITLNVALGGMKGITLVQAFQYWAKMFAISVPIFVLMAVYGHYGKQVGVNGKFSLPALETGHLVEHRSAYAIPNVEARVSAHEEGLMDSLVAKYDLRPRQIDPPSTMSDAAGHPLEMTGMNKARQIWTSMRHGSQLSFSATNSVPVQEVIFRYAGHAFAIVWTTEEVLTNRVGPFSFTARTPDVLAKEFESLLSRQGFEFIRQGGHRVFVCPRRIAQQLRADLASMSVRRESLPAKAPADSTWLNPFGPLTTKAAKNAAAAIGKRATNNMGSTGYQPVPPGDSPGGTAVASGTAGELNSNLTRSSIPAGEVADRNGRVARSTQTIPLRSDITPEQHLTVALDSPTVAQALTVYAELTGRKLVPNTNSVAERVDDLLNGKLSQLKLVTRGATPDSGVRFHGDGMFTAGEVKTAIETQLRTNGLAVVAVGEKAFEVKKVSQAVSESVGQKTSGAALPHSPTDSLTHSSEKAWLAAHEKPLALLYTYSLIIALVCGTAGLPHILVRFYTNPDGVAAKRTTMWVMILIGVFYLFPPVFGVLGRNLMPDLYNGIGAKGTDKIVLELPRILNAKYPPLGSILSGITCAGAFAAFMSTFSGLLVSMTGALAHDVYGRILRPKATADQRMRMFKMGAVIIGGVAILLGMQVEQLQINFMVGQAFAIAAASYFPLLFMSAWWPGMTMKGAATGMLTGGCLALAGISLTSFTDLKWLRLDDFWASCPLLRILCEQPAIWAVPLSLTLMVVVSKLTAKEVPGDIRMKMLVLHAPEKLGLKQEYIQEHQHGH